MSNLKIHFLHIFSSVCQEMWLTPDVAVLPPGSPELDGLLLAYSNSVGNVFYMAIGASVVVCAASFGMGWVDLRKKKVVVVGEKEKGNAKV